MAGVLFVVVTAGSAVGCGGHSESWQYGYDNAGPAAQLVSAGVAEESACRSISGVGDAGRELDRNEVVSGCLAALADASP